MRMDQVDRIMEIMLRSSNFPIPVQKISSGKYLIGTCAKKVILRGNQCFVRVGGGFQEISKYIEEKKKNEIDKLESFMDCKSDKKESLIEIIKNLLIHHNTEEKLLNNFIKKNSPTK